MARAPDERIRNGGRVEGHARPTRLHSFDGIDSSSPSRIGSSHHAGVADAASEDTVAECPTAARHPDVALAVAEHAGIALTASANAVAASPFADETASATASDPSESWKFPALGTVGLISSTTLSANRFNW